MVRFFTIEIFLYGWQKRDSHLLNVYSSIMSLYTEKKAMMKAQKSAFVKSSEMRIMTGINKMMFEQQQPKRERNQEILMAKSEKEEEF